MKTIKVNKIERGATIGVFSPSEPITKNREKRFKEGLSILESNGFKIKLSNNSLLNTNFTAGNINDRIEDIHDLIRDNSVDALIASWGGKSCSQLVPFLDYNLIAESNKPIMGFSDPCVLSNNITARTGLITFYGPNVIGKLDETKHSNLKLLSYSSSNNELLDDSKNSTFKVLRKGVSTGKLIGGNLSTFVLGVACSDILKDYFSNSIFIWEDAGNPPQIINQYLTALDNIGFFAQISGMIIGQFKTEDEKEWKKTDHFESMNTILSKYKFPILYAPIFGHSNLENPIFPIGASCKLDSDNSSLILIEDIIRG